LQTKLKSIESGVLQNCRFHFEAVVGEDTDHGGLHRGNWCKGEDILTSELNTHIWCALFRPECLVL